MVIEEPAMSQSANTLEQDKKDTLNIQTSRFGEISISRNTIITMTSPFLGFPSSKRFVLLPHGPQSPFMWLQSVDEPHLAFVVIHPSIISQDFNPDISKQIKDELRAAHDNEIDLLLILTIPKDDPQGMTANLLAPVMINPKAKLGRQTLLDPLKYECCWPVFSEE